MVILDDGHKSVIETCFEMDKCYDTKLACVVLQILHQCHDVGWHVDVNSTKNIFPFDWVMLPTLMSCQQRECVIFDVN